MTSTRHRPRVTASARASTTASERSGLILCACLAVQYATGPFLRDAYAADASPVSLVLATECIKAALSLARLLASRAERASKTLGITFTSLRRAAVPAGVYAMQNLLLARAAASGLGATAFNCLNQTKIVSGAVCLYVATGGRARQSFVQVVSLMAVVAAGMWLSASGEDAEPRGTASAASATAGAAYAATASALSGLSGALCQTLLQSGETSPAKMTLEMAITGAPMVLLVEKATRGTFLPSDAFAGWTALTLAPAFSAAIGGVLVGEITKRLGSIAKGFAVVCGLVLTGVLQAAAEGRAPPPSRVACLVVIVASTVAHTTHPYVERTRSSRRRRTKSKRA